LISPSAQLIEVSFRSRRQEGNIWSATSFPERS